MAFEHIPVATLIVRNAHSPKNTRGHLTTREMYAVRPDRSVLKTLLSAAKDKLARR